MRVARRIAFALTTATLIATFAVATIAWHQGYRVYAVNTGSMTPALRPGDLVLDKPARGGAARNLTPGAIVTFTTHNTLVTHRVVSVKNGVITTKGDANLTDDPGTLKASQVVGQRVATLPRMGFVLTRPLGIASVVVGIIGLALIRWPADKNTARHARPNGAARHARPNRECETSA